MRSALRISCLLALIATAGSAQFTGTWMGPLTVNDRCNNAPRSWTSPLVAAVVQTGDVVLANTLIANAPEFDQQCNITMTFPLVVGTSGRANGNVFTGAIALPDAPGIFSGTVTGDSMAVTITGEDFTASATLTRSSAIAPPSLHSGFHSGTYRVMEQVDNCNNVTSIDYSGPISGTLLHTGQLLTGTVTATGTKHYVRGATGSCTLEPDEDFVVRISGQISGTTIAGLIFGEEEGEDDGEFFPFTGTISGTTITITAADEEGQFSFAITKSTAPPPTIVSFAATPSSVVVGQPATLEWQTQNATTVTIDHGIGRRAASGSMQVRPPATTVFTLTAVGPGGSAQASVTVAVSPRPRVVLSAFPKGFVQRAGEGGGTDSFTLSNVGEASTTVTLTPAANFFTLDATSFELAAGAHRTVTITGLPQSADAYAGFVAFSGTGVFPEGVLVRMLSASPQAGTVRPRATRARAEIASNAGQSASGSVEFTNNGTATLFAVAVADVPWIIPQSGVIRIGPGETVAVSFTVDSAKRPDSESPLGAVTGKISLAFLGGSPTGPTIANGTPTSSVSVTLTYLVRPGVTPGSPPPLAEGELALFVAGLANQPTATGDLLLSNSLTSASLEKIDLYLQGGSATAQTTSIAQLQPNSSVALPGLVKNVLGTSVPSGSAQVRGVDVSKASVAAVQSNTSSPVGTYSTALPVFRSNRVVPVNAAAVLSGVEQSGSADTDLFVQETSGKGASFRVDFLNAAGQVLSTRAAESLGAFGVAEMRDAVPANTAAARIVNVSTTGTLAAYGVVSTPTTGDQWVITDPAAGSSGDDAFIVPILSAGAGATTTLYTTNRGDMAVAVTIDVRGGRAGRRRAVGRASSLGGLLKRSDSTSTLEPAQTMVTNITTTSGYARISGLAGAISTAARSVLSSGGAVFGSGLPAVPVSLALREGEVKRFAGADDASTASRTSAVPATFQTNLLLVETNAQPATVRVTVQFSFSGGALVSSTARVTKDYSVAANQSLLITNLAREVAGPSRDQFGDLRDMIVDVEVISGSGRIIPFVQSIDNGSADMIVRVD
jgi:hypothetical protein